MGRCDDINHCNYDYLAERVDVLEAQLAKLLTAAKDALAMPDGVHVGVWNEVRQQLREAIAFAERGAA